MIEESQSYRHHLNRPSKRERSNSLSVTSPLPNKKFSVNPPPIPLMSQGPPPPPIQTGVTPTNNQKSSTTPPVTSPTDKIQPNFVQSISTPPVNARKGSFDSN